MLLYLTCLDSRLDRDEISRRYPELIPGLVAHPGVALVVVDTTDVGPVALGRAGQHELATGRVVGEDPLAGFGPLAAQSLRRLAGSGIPAISSSSGRTTRRPARSCRSRTSWDPMAGSEGGRWSPSCFIPPT